MRALTHSRTVLDIESVLSVSIDNAIVRNIVEQTLQQTAVNEVIISSNVNPGTKKFQYPECSELIAVSLVKNGNLSRKKKDS